MLGISITGTSDKSSHSIKLLKLTWRMFSRHAKFGGSRLWPILAAEFLAESVRQCRILADEQNF